MPSSAHGGNSVDAGLKIENNVDAEPIHADIRTVANQFFEIVEVGSVPRVPNHHARQVHALFTKNALLIESPAKAGMRVR